MSLLLKNKKIMSWAQGIAGVFTEASHIYKFCSHQLLHNGGFVSLRNLSTSQTYPFYYSFPKLQIIIALYITHDFGSI